MQGLVTLPGMLLIETGMSIHVILPLPWSSQLLVLQVLQAGDSELASARLQELTISWKQPDKLRRQDVTFMGARTPTSIVVSGFANR